MSDRKADFHEHCGIGRRGAERAMAEDERRALNEDPRTIAVVRAAERREAERQAEQRRRIEEDRQRQGSSPAS